MIPEIIQHYIDRGEALTRLDAKYPLRYNRKVPLKVKMLKTTISEMPYFLSDVPICVGGNEYYVSVNSYGAVTAIFEDGRQLGLKPDEFEVIQFHD